MNLEVHIDGGARGNPGPAAAGVVICGPDGQRLLEAGYYLGRHTNNHAEYSALLIALRRVVRVGAAVVHIHSDSELLVRQMIGEYRVKSPALAPLHAEAHALLRRVDSWRITHVRRDQNRRADQLVNAALDRQADVVEYDAAPPECAAPTSCDSPVPGPVPDPQPERAGLSSGARHAPGDTVRRIRVSVATPPSAVCGARPDGFGDLYVADALPSGLCLHAAHALLPTLLAMKALSSEEVAHTPAITLRCMRPGCGAVFQLTIPPSQNGHRPAPG